MNQTQLSDVWSMLDREHLASEVLETGELNVRRPAAEELAAIRDGALSYNALLA